MQKTMTLDEKLTILCKVAALRQTGNGAEHDRLVRSVPMPPYLAKIYKEKVGVNHLINGG